MKLPTQNPEHQWVETARKLRHVRRTCLQFLDRWAIGHLLDDASALDRVAGDIVTSDTVADESVAGDIGKSCRPEASETDSAIADHANRDWSVLYRGSVLDD
jgi:hypothetical protein